MTCWKHFKLADNLRITELGHTPQNVSQVDMRLTSLKTKGMTTHLHHQRKGSEALIGPSLPENTSLETEKWQQLGFAHADKYNILERYPFTLLCQRVTKGTLYTAEATEQVSGDSLQQQVSGDSLQH